jgi:hypothetical protein
MSAPAGSERQPEAAAFEQRLNPYAEWEARIPENILGVRLQAIANLRDQAEEVITNDEPECPEDVLECLRPAFVRYAEALLDRWAESQLRISSGSTFLASLEEWRRVVIEDVCGPIYGQYFLTLRHLANSLGDEHFSRRALWGLVPHASWLRIMGPDGCAEKLRSYLMSRLANRRLLWKGRALSMAPAPEGRPPAAQAPIGATPDALVVPIGNGVPPKGGSPAGDRTEPEQEDQLQGIRKVERAQRFTEAIERWRPQAKRAIPFSWIYAAANVHRGEAYEWKNGILPDRSTMSKNIEEVLKRAEPPPKPNPSEDDIGPHSY